MNGAFAGVNGVCIGGGYVVNGCCPSAYLVLHRVGIKLGVRAVVELRERRQLHVVHCRELLWVVGRPSGGALSWAQLVELSDTHRMAGGLVPKLVARLVLSHNAWVDGIVICKRLPLPPAAGHIESAANELCVMFADDGEGRQTGLVLPLLFPTSHRANTKPRGKPQGTPRAGGNTQKPRALVESRVATRETCQ